MSIAFVSSRELSKQPGLVLRRLKRNGAQIITLNGVPAATLLPASGLGIEADLDLIHRVRMGQALAATQAEAARNGSDNLTMDAIDAEVAAVRGEVKNKRTGKK
ncbi:MAG: hypothetical protein H7343_12975 [Undibacterium sp.]|nr:hypothetical protein [Opitutaceae bacterium]